MILEIKPMTSRNSGVREKLLTTRSAEHLEGHDETGGMQQTRETNTPGRGRVGESQLDGSDKQILAFPQHQPSIDDFVSFCRKYRENGDHMIGKL
jgi:hypothetical protein